MNCVTLIVGCPVEGQIRLECASHPSCHRRCDRLSGPIPCPQVCIHNGCQCPIGRVIDVQTNKCVFPRQCSTRKHYSVCIISMFTFNTFME